MWKTCWHVITFISKESQNFIYWCYKFFLLICWFNMIINSWLNKIILKKSLSKIVKHVDIVLILSFFQIMIFRVTWYFFLLKNETAPKQIITSTFLYSIRVCIFCKVERRISSNFEWPEQTFSNHHRVFCFKT